MARRPDEFVCDEAAARHRRQAELAGRVVEACGTKMAPLTPRHAQRHLTTLRHRRLRGAWLTAPAVGERRSRPIASAGCERRITRTRLGAMAETRVISGEGIQSPFRSGRGSLCTVILLIGPFRVRRCAAGARRRSLVVDAHSLVDHWIGPALREGERCLTRCELR